ncbi:unnamed protein product [Chrysoparadoxa australica]
MLGARRKVASSVPQAWRKVTCFAPSRRGRRVVYSAPQPGAGIPCSQANMKIASPPPETLEDNMPRYASLQSPQGMLRGMTYLATINFSIAGGVTAAEAGMDLVGCCIVGALNALGGATVRDLLLGRDGHPVVWMREAEYYWLSSITATLVFLSWQYMEPDRSVIECTDALGVGATCVIGTQCGIRKACTPAVCIASGMINATFGGVMRDVLCHKPPHIMYSNAELYASTAVAGSGVYVGLKALGMRPAVKIAGSLATALGLRLYARMNDVNLPTYQRPNLEG